MANDWEERENVHRLHQNVKRRCVAPLLAVNPRPTRSWNPNAEGRPAAVLLVSDRARKEIGDLSARGLEEGVDVDVSIDR
jgi:hypothetical protein